MGTVHTHRDVSRAVGGRMGASDFAVPLSEKGSDGTCGRRLSLQDYSGTAGQQSGLAMQGTNFSTRDADNDNCLCKCAQMLSGGEQQGLGRGPRSVPTPVPLLLLPPIGWWFDACGLSNLNGIYYPARHNIRKLNGIRWHYFQGPSYSLKGTRMLIRPAGF